MKPSDTPERILERVRRKRRRDRRERLVTDANALAEYLPREQMSRFWDRAFAGDLPYSPGQTPIARFHGLLEDEFGRNLDIWESITGERLESLSKLQKVALAAYLADRERVEREGRSLRLPRASWTGSRAGEPWFRRLKDQLESEAAYSGREAPEDVLDHWATVAILWAFGRGVARYEGVRKLRLRNGGTKSFKIWPRIPASGVRPVPASEFHTKRVFPIAKQWQRRLDWDSRRWRTQPTKLHQLWKPLGLTIEGRYRQRSPLWAAPTPEDDAIRLRVSENTQLEHRATASREKSARIRDHAELMRSMYELSEAFDAGLEAPRLAA